MRSAGWLLAALALAACSESPSDQADVQPEYVNTEFTIHPINLITPPKPAKQSFGPVRPRQSGIKAHIVDAGSVDEEDIPDCGRKVNQAEWLKVREKWTDTQFKADLGFNRFPAESDVHERPNSGGANLTKCLTCFSDNVLEECARNCTNRTGGEGMHFFTVWTGSALGFTTRHRRSIESVLYHHPQASVVIFSDTLANSTTATAYTHLALLQSMGCQVRIEALNLVERVRSLPLEAWAQKPDVRNSASAHFQDHVAAAVLLATLYQSGGVAFQPDVIFLNSILSLGNSVGRQRSSTTAPMMLGSHVLVFDAGNDFINQVMTTFATNYVPSAGPNFLDSMLTKAWSGSSTLVTVLSSSAFDALTEKNIHRALEIRRREDVDHDSKTLREAAFAVSFCDFETRGHNIFQGSLLYKLLKLFCLECDQEV